MKKKAYLSTLLLLVLYTLLNLSSISFADNLREWTTEDLKNIIYKYAMNNNADYSNEYINLINQNSNTIQTIVNEMNIYKYVCICRDSTWIYIKYTNSEAKWYLYRNQPTINTSNGNWYKINSIKLKQNDFTYQILSYDSSEQMYNYGYVSKDVETSATNSTIAKSARILLPNNIF